MVDKVTVNPLEVRGAGDIVSPKTLTDFGFYKTYLNQTTDTINNLPTHVFIVGSRQSQESLELIVENFIDYSEDLKSFPLTAVLRNGAGRFMVGATLTCTVNGLDEYTGVTNSRGQVVFHVPVSYEGKYFLSVEYKNTTEAGSVAGVVRDVAVFVGELNSLSLKASKNPLGTNDNSSLVCNVDCLVDNEVYPAEGVPVSFYEEFDYSYFAVVCPETVLMGQTIPFKARFCDVDGSGISGQPVSFYEEYEQGDLVFINPAPYASSGEITSISARLSDVDGSGIANQEIKFYEEYTADNISLQTANVVVDGSVTGLSARICDSDGSFVQVPNREVSFYESFVLSDVNLMIDNSVVEVDENLPFKVRVADSDGSAISGMTVYFYEEFTREDVLVKGSVNPMEIDDVTSLSATVLDTDGSLVRDVPVHFEEEIVESDGFYFSPLTIGSPVITEDEVSTVAVRVRDRSNDSEPVSGVFVRFLADMIDDEIIIPESDVLPVGSVVFSVAPSTVTYGGSVTLSATVMDSGGSVMSGETVTFKDGSTTIGTASTNSNGVASLSKSDLSVGSHTLTAVAGEVISSSQSVTVNALPVATSIALSADNSILSYYDSDSAVLSALVKDQNGAVMSGQSVTFKQGSTVLDTVQTGSDGVAEYTYASAGSGDVSFTASVGSLVSETYSVEDCLLYDPTGFSKTITSNADTTYSSGYNYSLASISDFEMEFDYNNPPGFRLYFTSNNIQDGEAFYYGIGFTRDAQGKFVFTERTTSTNNTTCQSINSGTNHYRVVFTGNTVNVWVNDVQQVTDKTLSWWSSHFPYYFNWAIWATGTGTVTNIKIKPL